MGSPYKYQSSWKTEDLFTDYYTKDDVDTLFTTKVIPALASAPTAVQGRMYFNTTDNQIYIYTGTDWQVLHQTVLTTAAPVFIETGNPMGLLLGLTYQL